MLLAVVLIDVIVIKSYTKISTMDVEIASLLGILFKLSLEFSLRCYPCGLFSSLFLACRLHVLC